MVRSADVERPRESDGDQPCYVISVAARLVGVHAQTLRYYERLGLVEPARSQGNIRLYSPRDIQRLHRIKSLIEDLGMNLAGVEVAMRMATQMEAMERDIQRLAAELRRSRRNPGTWATASSRSANGWAWRWAWRRRRAVSCP